MATSAYVVILCAAKTAPTCRTHLKSLHLDNDNEKWLFTYCLIYPRPWHVPLLQDSQWYFLDLWLILRSWLLRLQPEVCGSRAVAKSSYLAELVSTSSILLLKYLIPIKQNKYIHKRKKRDAKSSWQQIWFKLKSGELWSDSLIFSHSILKEACRI